MKKARITQAGGSREMLGIIIPNEWDAEGRTTAWAISTYSEKVYQIDTDNEIGKRLPDIAGKKIKVHGVLDGADDSAPTMTITDYVIIEDADFFG